MFKFSNCPANIVQMREGEVLMKMLIRSLGSFSYYRRLKW